ncbi:kinesin protein KIF21B [Tropilaelaps mercedesae]|uniref:Kinesin protein KIF21B n=1 Tax=Tropilaelaps mercedesae TaxID=418985 RepID=A0A1V9XUW3_9ACAR|nr:kinesin protein KIF21B [Tropilaelaps mercedesae]
MQAAQKTAEAKELEARLEQVENNYSQTERLLQMTIETPDKALSQVMEGLELQGGQESQASSRSVSPAESCPCEDFCGAGRRKIECFYRRIVRRTKANSTLIAAIRQAEYASCTL